MTPPMRPGALQSVGTLRIASDLTLFPGPRTSGAVQKPVVGTLAMTWVKRAEDAEAPGANGPEVWPGQ